MNAGAPAVFEFGLKEVIASGGLIAKDAALEVTPPRATVIVAVLAVAMRPAGTGAVS